MKHILTIALLLLACMAAAQPKAIQATVKIEILEGVVEGEEAALFDVDAGMPAVLGSAKVKDGRAELRATVPAAGVYAVSVGKEYVVFVIIADTSTLVLQIDMNGGDYDGTVFLGSPVNKEFFAYMSRSRNIITSIQEVREQQRTRPNDSTLQRTLDSLQMANFMLHDKQAFRELDDSGFEESLGKGEPILAAIGTLYAYRPYDKAHHPSYTDERQYFQQNYFREQALEDANVAYLPMLFDKLYYYTATLVGQMGVQGQQAIAQLEALAKRLPQDARSQRQLQMAAMRVGREADEELYLHFAEAFVRSQPNHNLTPNLVADIAQRNRLRVGNLAPDFGQATPEGKTILLSSLRGRVVLIDFWASWCGPCRQENPNVVQAYKQYKDKGFEILGVSLDQNREAWVKAIEKDKLSWLHVSDLGYWNNAVAKQYGVEGIPFTVLVDKEGRIIAKNLRGQALYAKLAQLFDK